MFSPSISRQDFYIKANTMKQSNPLSDFIQFIIGGYFFAAGVLLLSNQVMARAPIAIGSAVRPLYGGGWGSGFAFPWGRPGMGFLLLPLVIGLCMAFAGVYARWSKLLSGPPYLHFFLVFSTASGCRLYQPSIIRTRQR